MIRATRNWLRQVFCRHHWAPTRFQALVGGTTYECTRCRKFKQGTV